MSYVVTIKRAVDKAPLTPEEVAHLVRSDASLSGGDKVPIVWTNPTNGRTRYINVETDHLWTDDLKGDDDSQVLEILDKLRSIARILDARVFGEADGDITDPDVEPRRSVGCTKVLVYAAVLIGVGGLVIYYWR